MLRDQDRRRDPRLRLSYPIELRLGQNRDRSATRGVTANLSARGAFFKTFAWQQFRIGRRVNVEIEVPHPLHGQGEFFHLKMKARGRIRRMDRIEGYVAYGEDGIDQKGVAVEFDAPLDFNYFWA